MLPPCCHLILVPWRGIDTAASPDATSSVQLSSAANVSAWHVDSQEDFMRSAERQMEQERLVAEKKGEVGHGATTSGDKDDDNDDDNDDASLVGGFTPRGSPS